jgi:Tfp pilus assembly protein PilX
VEVRNLKVGWLGNEHGFLLVAALALLSALTLAGTTAYILASTDIKIGGNFRNSHSALQVAMAGAERARESLRQENLTSTDPASLSDELAKTTRLGANATLEGYTSTTDDQPIATGTINGIAYTVYLTNDSVDGSSSTTDTNGRVMVTSLATGTKTKAIVQTVISMFMVPLASTPGALYSQDNVTLSGSSIHIDGTDACHEASSLAPVYTLDPATTTLNGGPQLGGSSSSPAHGTTSIDIASYVEARKAFATTTLTADQSGTTYGSSSNYVTVYADATQQADGELRLNNVTGYGILAVKGNLQLAGNINWTGIILVTGTITGSGGGSNSKNIQGQVLTGSSALGDTSISGSVTIGYDSCKIKQTLNGQPLKLSHWKQSY